MRRARKERWQDHFWSAVAAADVEPFEWGSSDCVLKAARIADAIVAEPCFESLARTFIWSDESTAIVRIDEAGGLKAAIESVLGAGVPWHGLSQGDLVLCATGSDEHGLEHCVAVHDGVSPIVFVAGGMRPLPWRLAVCGWEV